MSRRRKKSTAVVSYSEAQRIHAKRRAAQRYDLTLNKAAYRQLRDMIHEGTFEARYAETNRIVHYVLFIEGTGRIPVIYDTSRRNIVTFLPSHCAARIFGLAAVAAAITNPASANPRVRRRHVRPRQLDVHAAACREAYVTGQAVIVETSAAGVHSCKAFFNDGKQCALFDISTDDETKCEKVDMQLYVDVVPGTPLAEEARQLRAGTS